MSGRISEGGILKVQIRRGPDTSLAPMIATTVRLALGVVKRDDASLFVNEELRLSAERSSRVKASRDMIVMSN